MLDTWIGGSLLMMWKSHSTAGPGWDRQWCRQKSLSALANQRVHVRCECDSCLSTPKSTCVPVVNLTDSYLPTGSMQCGDHDHLNAVWIKQSTLGSWTHLHQSRPRFRASLRDDRQRLKPLGPWRARIKHMKCSTHQDSTNPLVGRSSLHISPLWRGTIRYHSYIVT